MRSISILGSTGSIGTSALQVARHLGPDRIRVKALAARRNLEKLKMQIEEFRPELAVLFEEEEAEKLRALFPQLEVLAGMEGLKAVASYPGSDLVVSSMSGAVGLEPTLSAIRAKKTVALANKEVLVAGGSFVMRLAERFGAQLLPVDSEHSAIFQCLQGEKRQQVQRAVLTASGGPFRAFSREQMESITVESALKHPTWQMGPKNTIDSSTLMNKGLEVIEAHLLFDLPLEQIEVVIHPQSLVHSIVEFIDGSMMAQLSEPSMLLPLQYAMTYPDRLPGMMERFDFLKNSVLEFYPPDLERFRCLSLAYASAGEGGSFPCYLNAANEVLVERFLRREIGWSDLAKTLEGLLARHKKIEIDSMEAILHVDRLARLEAATA